MPCDGPELPSQGAVGDVEIPLRQKISALWGVPSKHSYRPPTRFPSLRCGTARSFAVRPCAASKPRPCRSGPGRSGVRAQALDPVASGAMSWSAASEMSSAR